MADETRPAFELSYETYQYWKIDRERRRRGVVLRSGEEQWSDIPADDGILDSQMAMTVFDWEKWWTWNLTLRGDWLAAEVYSPIPDDPKKGRTTVYLDQNHWSTLALVRVDPDSVTKRSEIGPAEELIELAADGGVILPLSAGHLVETGRLYDDKRYNLGLVMADLANGWQMRHPLALRKFEFAQALGRELGRQVPSLANRQAITLEPNALLDNEPDSGPLPVDDPAFFLQAISSSSITMESLLDPKADPRFEPEQWLADNKSFAEALTSSPASQAEKKIVSRVRTLISLREEMLAGLGLLGASASDFNMTDSKTVSKFLRSMPMIDAYAHVNMVRHIDRNWMWNDPGDLIDMVYLSAGAAYADFVVAEGATGTHLRQYQMAMNKPVTVHTTLESLVKAIRNSGVTTATERERAAIST
ncbi:hypothetical protein FEZ60_30865 [Rhodococcus sp. MS16]|uniref:hypothetical protein n=1 Tax=Rhodococcus sp. MS16 TaxID=2579941 RepID=UPI001562607C|nr:hypothetical protein [Rhodococcus sp. MS16]NRI69912.1 hypothetical protein [Rhodococcus sp. MS16]